MGRGHTALVFPQGSWLSRMAFYLSRHQSPPAPRLQVQQSFSAPVTQSNTAAAAQAPGPTPGRPPDGAHLFVQEGLALKLQAPELQPPGNMDVSQCDLWLPTLGSKCRPPRPLYYN